MQKNGQAESRTLAELLALEEALKRCRIRKFYPQQVYLDCITMVDLIHKDDLVTNWRFSEKIKAIRGYLKECTSVRLEVITRQLNLVADKLAKFVL